MNDQLPPDDNAITTPPIPANPPVPHIGAPHIGASHPIDLSPAGTDSARKKRSPMPFVLAILAVVAIAAGAIAVAAGGGEGHKVLTLAEAAANTESKHTARVEFTTSVPLAGFAGQEVLATGVYDFDQQLLHYEFDMTDLLKTKTPSVPAGAGKISAEAHGLVIFMRMGIFDQAPTLKGKSMKLDLGQQITTFGLDLDKVTEFETAGPASALARLQALSGAVETVGTEDVRGVKTTHYRATYDFAQVYRARGAITDEAAFKKLLDLYASTTATTEAWVDDDGLVRRTLNAVPLKAATQTVKAEFFDFGVKVNVTLPADADTFGVEELKALGGS